MNCTLQSGRYKTGIKSIFLPCDGKRSTKLHTFHLIFSAFDDISTNLANDIRGSYYCMARNKLGSDFGNRINVRMPIRYTPTMLKQKGTLTFKIFEKFNYFEFSDCGKPTCCLIFCGQKLFKT